MLWKACDGYFPNPVAQEWICQGKSGWESRFSLPGRCGPTASPLYVVLTMHKLISILFQEGEQSCGVCSPGARLSTIWPSLYRVVYSVAFLP